MLELDLRHAIDLCFKYGHVTANRISVTEIAEYSYIFQWKGGRHPFQEWMARYRFDAVEMPVRPVLAILKPYGGYWGQMRILLDLIMDRKKVTFSEYLKSVPDFVQKWVNIESRQYGLGMNSVWTRYELSMDSVWTQYQDRLLIHSK